MPKKKANTAQNRDVKFWRRSIITGFLAAALLVVANSAFWVNRQIFDTNNFTTTAVASVTSDSSREAIANEVVDTALKDRPIIRQVAGPTAVKLVSSLLGTNQFNNILTVAVDKIQVYLTSENQESIVLNLSSIKSTLNSLIGLAGESNSQASTDLQNVPDQIVLVNADNIPSFYKYGLLFLWLGPISAIVALVLLAYPYIRSRSRYYVVAVVQGALIAVMGMLAMFIGPLFRPPVLANIQSANMRVVVGNLYDAFIATFNSQSMWLIWGGVVIAVVPAAVHFGLRYYHTLMLRRKKA